MKLNPGNENVSPIACEAGRAGTSVEALTRNFLEHLLYTNMRLLPTASPHDLYSALAYTVRDQLLHRFVKTVREFVARGVKVVNYLSAEFLMGPHLENNLINLGIYAQAQEAVESLGFDLQTIIAAEEEPGLGNGGLGRLAACYMDSLATLEVLAIGYGIRYEFGIFDQKIQDGWQHEITDKWLRLGNPWEIPQPEINYHIKLGGRTEAYYDKKGNYRVRWIPNRIVKGVAYDTPIAGYRVNTCNLLRLWKAEAVESFHFESFNMGDYYGAVEDTVRSEKISKVLYPNDEPVQGKILRLEQQYFFVSCSLQNMLHMQRVFGGSPQDFHKHFVVQLNDTHPSVGVAELMRLLLDDHHMDWDTAWEITRNTFAYTNHTLLPEALEKWPLVLFQSLLPRHMEIIYEINRRFLDEVRSRYPNDEQRLARMSLIDETGERYVRMAHLACVGSFSINGVAQLHTELLKHTVLRDFFEMMPEKFNNKTNGITPRRFLVQSNPELNDLVCSRIGNTWIKDLYELRGLEKMADDAAFRQEWSKVKLENKQRFAAIIRERTGIEVDPSTLFDIQAKRIHEYKRQHLNVLHIITQYCRIKRNPQMHVCPRTFIFGGKAAPAYFMAKLIIKLINSVGEVVNKDPDVGGRLKVAFFPDFNVKNGQFIYPAADLSEQISTAGKEASGTGNMKFSLNGALTIGTLDGANVEILEEVGRENFFLFGLTAREVLRLKTEGYHPRNYYDSNDELREALDLLSSGAFSRGDRELFKPLVDSLLNWDEYMLLADYASYIETQGQVEAAFLDSEKWTRMSILNVARMGKFSSDRAIREYCRDIWKVEPVCIDLSQ